MKKICHLVDRILEGLFMRFAYSKLSDLFLVSPLEKIRPMVVMIVKIIVRMVVVHHRDQNLVRNLRNQLVHLNVDQGYSIKKKMFF